MSEHGLWVDEWEESSWRAGVVLGCREGRRFRTTLAKSLLLHPTPLSLPQSAWTPVSPPMVSQGHPPPTHLLAR